LFIDYAERERACDKLKRLSMAGDYVDEYVTTFEVLACRANMKLDDPANLQMFVQGFPRGLAERCIDIESPNTFAQWMHTAQ